MRCPRAGVRHLCTRAALDIMPAGKKTGVRGARCNRGRRRRETPAICGAALREAWSGAESLGCVSPLDKSRRGTPEGVLPPPIPSPASGGGSGWGQAPHRKVRRLMKQRLSAFCFLFVAGSESKRFCRLGRAKRNPPKDAMGYAAELVIGPATSGRTRWRLTHPPFPCAVADRDGSGSPLPDRSDEGLVLAAKFLRLACRKNSGREQKAQREKVGRCAEQSSPLSRKGRGEGAPREEEISLLHPPLEGGGEK